MWWRFFPGSGRRTCSIRKCCRNLEESFGKPLMADLKQLARQIFHETLAAIDIAATMQRKLRRAGTRLLCDGKILDLREFDKLREVAIGKAAHEMVDGLAQVLAPFLRFEGVGSAPTAPRKPLPGMKYFVGGHPIPNEESWRAAEAILALLKKCDEKTLAFFLLSGGGSALVELPLDPGQTLEDLQQMYRVLVTCGAPIYAINAARFFADPLRGTNHRKVWSGRKSSDYGPALD